MFKEKGVMAFFMIFVLLVSVAPTFVIADDDSGSSGTDSVKSDGSNSDSGSNSGAVVDSNDDSGNDDGKDTLETDGSNSSSGSSNTVREVKREVTTDDGRKIEVERKVEIVDGKRKIEIKRKITDENGNEREIKIMVEERDDGRRVVKIEGRDDINVETDLNIDQAENDSSLEATTSDGIRHRVIVLPDNASEIARERLKSRNLTIDLREIKDRNVSRVVYNAEANKDGRFLGIFKLRVKVDTQIDPETGEVISVRKPWWALFVAGEDNPDETFDNSNDNLNISFTGNETTE